MGEELGLRFLTILAVFLIGFSATAYGADNPETKLQEEDFEPPPPVVQLQRIPPRFSYDLEVQIGLASMTQFIDYDVPVWPGFGVRGAWGKNFGLHRAGFGGTVSIEGPAPQFYSIGLEAFGAWHYVSSKGLALGATLGPTVMLHNHLTRLGTDRWFALVPALGLQLGYSQTWSRVGRRVHVYLEPKLRWMANNPGVIVSVVVGSGRGK